MIASRDQIATTSEPWLLLPFVYAIRRTGIYTEYKHRDQLKAFEDFCQNLPNGMSDYYEAIRRCTENLYYRFDPQAQFFLDKTPRYSLIAEELYNIFPNGKFIYLWRNPLAIVASIIDTFGKGRWNVFKYYVDLYQGLTNLLSTFEAQKENVLAVNYEAFLQDPATEAKKIFNYLDLTYDQRCLEEFQSVELKGRMGDPTGRKEYAEINGIPRDKWKETLNTPLRKRFGRKYLEWIGKKNLELMGYDLAELLSELNSTKASSRYFLSDLFWINAGPIVSFFEPKLFWDKMADLKAVRSKGYMA